VRRAVLFLWPVGRSRFSVPFLLMQLIPIQLLIFSTMVVSGLRLDARPWSFVGIPEPLEAEFVGMEKGGVVLRGPNGKSFEVPFANFSPADQTYLRALEAGSKVPVAAPTIRTLASRRDYPSRSVAALTQQVVPLSAPMELHITGTGDPVAGSTFLFSSPDAWLFFDKIRPSEVISKFLKQMTVAGKPAAVGNNLRVVQYGEGAVVIPHSGDFAAVTGWSGKSMEGEFMPFQAHTAYDQAALGNLKGGIHSIRIKRGYSVTLASKENGGGVSRNYVAQDHDLVIDDLPPGLDGEVRFVRVFPWRWVNKKGIAGAIAKNLDVSWFYDWNISTNSSPDLEYVPIRQNRWWPGLNQNWKTRGSTHLLGFNEPDRPDQAKMTVDEAISAWPALLATGLRLGSPAPSDGGLNWLYEFIDKADKGGLRVDFVPVHYYRATADPGDAKGAAAQFYRFLKGVHDRVQRPLWITEWNNGANWTKAPDPNERQQKAAITAMIKMLDETPFVERYALYNWVEDCRALQRKDGTLTPAGEAYRDHVSAPAFAQPKRAK
jgi:hypothetical protein